MSPSPRHAAPTRGNARRRVQSALASAIVATLAVMGLTAPALAATPLSVSIAPPGSITFEGASLGSFVEGGKGALLIEYDVLGGPIAPGDVYYVDFTGPFTLPAVVPIDSGNPALQSVTYDAASGRLRVEFAPVIPAGTASGVLTMDLTANAVTESGKVTLGWSVKSSSEAVITTGSRELVVVDSNDTPTTLSTHHSKAVQVAGGSLDSFVSVDGTGTVTVDSAITSTLLTYTVVVNTTAALTNYTITDTLARELEYMGGAVAVDVDTWDANGLNHTSSTTSFVPTYTLASGTTPASFTGDMNLAANSRYTFTYQARVAPDQVAALEATLQAQYDALPLGVGSISTSLGNSVVFPDSGQTAGVGVQVGKSFAGPDADGAFSKSVSPAQVVATLAADGTLPTAVPLTYTLTANLGTWNGASPAFVLDRNVVIADTPPTGIVWDATDPATFLQVTGATLTQAVGFAGTAADFADDAYVGQWALVGSTLLVNVGKDAATQVSIAAKATAQAAGAKNIHYTPPGYEAQYQSTNTATFTYAASGTVSKGADFTVLDPGDTTGPRVDRDYFSKSSSLFGSEIRAAAGDTLTIPFTFVVNDWGAQGGVKAASRVDLTEATLVDTIDTSVFTFDSVADVTVTSVALSGAPWNRALTASDLVMVKNGNDLEVSIDPAYFTDPNVAAVTDVQLTRFELQLSLVTKPLPARTTLTLTNAAELRGSSTTTTYTDSASGNASSFGNEAEVRKEVYDPARDSWTTALRAEVDEDGNLVTDEFVYRLTFIQHGAYATVPAPIPSVSDVLPDGMEFLGFVDADLNLLSPTGYPVSTLPGGGQQYQLPGSANLDAIYSVDGTGRDVVTIQTRSGNRGAGYETTVSFRVRVTNAQEDVVVLNSIGTVSASIIPSDGYPLSVRKQDVTDPDVVIDDASARFTVTYQDPVNGPTPVYTDVYVHNNLLVRSEGGVEVAVVVPEVGTYTITETRAPAGYLLSTDSVVATVATDGSTSTVVFYNEPNPAGPVAEGTFSLAKVLSNADSVTGLPATYALEYSLDAGGTWVTAAVAAGAASADVTVPAGTEVWVREAAPSAITDATWAAVSWAVTGATAITPVPTGAQAAFVVADGAEVTATATNTITANPVAPPATYAIGDFTWVDLNRNGAQDTGEEVLPGVTVNLLNADGTPYLNGGTAVTTTTNSQGRYIFDLLPAGTYRVEFVLTTAQAARYVFTSVGGGGGTDSDATPQATVSVGRTGVITLGPTNTQLVTSGYTPFTVAATEGIDPTWDAGVVYREAAVSVSKVVVGPDGTTTDVTLTWTATAPTGVTLTTAQQSGTITLPGDGVAVTLAVTFPLGTTVAFDEDVAPTFVGWTFDSVASVPAVATATDGSVESVTVTNTYVRMPSVSVGDLVWVDKNGNGVQEAGDTGIPGVTLRITQTNGVPVRTIDGVLVPDQITDPSGLYRFSNLPVLPAGEHYTVTVDTVASATALAPYVPTLAGTTGRELDSSTWTAESVDLTVDGAHDGSLDFGFVLASPPGGGLAFTGADSLAGLLSAAAALLVAGLVMVGVRRRIR